jgi:hypothetical protein
MCVLILHLTVVILSLSVGLALRLSLWMQFKIRPDVFIIEHGSVNGDLESDLWVIGLHCCPPVVFDHL